MENFGGGEGEPDEAVGEDENAESAPNDEARAVKRRRSFGVDGGGARKFAGPPTPEAVEAVRDFRGGKQNHQSDAEYSGADQILNERITHCAGI